MLSCSAPNCDWMLNFNDIYVVVDEVIYLLFKIHSV